MNTFDKGYIVRLKQIIVQNFTGEDILSSDCYKLSFEIQKKTNKRVSETTLKRFFGYTNSTHNPSQYTLNAISRYCGYQSWENFKEHVDLEAVKNAENKGWHEVKTALTKTTKLNIFLAKQKIWNDAHQKINITPISECIKRFINTSQNLMVNHAAAGMGKTLQMIHWIDNHLSDKSQNDIVLYLDSLSLFQSSIYGYNAYRWLANILDFPTIQSIHDFIATYKDEPPGILHIVLDGFSEEILPEKQYYAVLKNFIEMISEYKDCQWIKFTLILRTNIYQKLKKKTLKTRGNEWYLDKYFLNGETLKYNTKLISSTLNHFEIDHSLNKLTSSNIYEWMKDPRFLSWFIDRKKIAAQTDFRDPELKFLFIHELFQNNPLFFTQLEQVDDLNLENIILKIPYKEVYEKNQGQYLWSKTKTNILQGLDLYHELLGQGIIEIDPYLEQYQIYFSFPEYKAYLIAFRLYYLLRKQNPIHFHHALVGLIDQDPELERATCIFFLLFRMEESPQALFEENVIFLDLLGNDTWYLLAIFAQNTYYGNDQFLTEDIKKGIARSHLLRKVVYESNLPYPLVRKVLIQSLELMVEESQLFQLRLKLATLSFMAWDEDEFIKQLEYMSSFASRTEGTWSVQVVEGLSALYNYIRYEKINQNDITQIININYSKDVGITNNEDELSFEFVGYLLNITAQSPGLAAKYLKTIQLKRSRINDQSNLVFIIYYLLEKIIDSIATGRTPSLQDEIHIGFIHEFEQLEKPSFLQIITRILSFH